MAAINQIQHKLITGGVINKKAPSGLSNVLRIDLNVEFCFLLLIYIVFILFH